MPRIVRWDHRRFSRAKPVICESASLLDVSTYLPRGERRLTECRRRDQGRDSLQLPQPVLNDRASIDGPKDHWLQACREQGRLGVNPAMHVVSGVSAVEEARADSKRVVSEVRRISSGSKVTRRRIVSSKQLHPG